ncbi:response regulator [Cohnella hongkongensis]|uniref:Response regulator n=1 Tax=Cohnella hongkongensis TaxID=178337 RepID=A0ABV9F775_9BACL
MLQVLLVDDEPLAHHHLRHLLDWDKHGFQLAGEAYSAGMALEMIERSRPHVVIIDVDMPGANGVELNRTIRDRYPDIKTFMLSSYDDYDYVRECLNSGALDYLLKHRLDESALISMLNKAERDLRQESRNFHRPPSARASLDPAALRDIVSDLARGKPESAKELEAYADGHGLYPDAKSYVAAVVQIIPFLLLTESYSDVQRNRMVQQAVDILQQSLGDIRERTAAYVEDGRFIVLFAFQERSEHAVASEADRQMSKLRHSLELFLNLKCICEIGHACGSLPQLAASYASAQRKLDRPGPGLFEERASLSIEEQKLLLLAVERQDHEAIQRLLAAIFASLRSYPFHSHTVQAIVGELLKVSDKAFKEGLAPARIEPNELPPRDDLGRIAAIGQLERWMQNYYAAMLNLLKRQRASGSYSRHVSQAIRYVRERYRESVTLELAAKHVGLNPSYLSRIFKEETNSTFSEYLNRVRIEAGRKLLESGQYSVKQISDQVGFGTYNYFFKVFKETTGMTPHAYVNSLGRQ